MLRDCSYMSPKNKHKHSNDNVYINMNFKYYKNRKDANALVLSKITNAFINFLGKRCKRLLYLLN